MWDSHGRPERPWYWKTLDRCSICYSFGVLKKIKYNDQDNALLGFACRNRCARADSEYGINVGVAIANWNITQRKIKKENKKC